MCGIAGILKPSCAPAELIARLSAVQSRLRHRGPDDEGIFAAPDASAGLVHTRLSILDLSAAGHQPMTDDTGRYVMVFNGEIYNFRQLRAELADAGEQFTSGSDSEVILKMYRRYGPNCVREFEGMFAFAIWDQVEKTCFLARDPLGIKPLYYHEHAGTLAFASELRALLAFPQVPRRVSPAALQGYLLFGSVQEPDTLIEGVRCLPAGHWLLWRDGRAQVKRFWDVLFAGEKSTLAEAQERVRAALLDSVRRHFVADVPVGIFLSGGIDSTSLVALARVLGHEQLRTFSISFEDRQFDEGPVARRTAEHFGTTHHDWRMDAATGRKLIQEFLARSDQPSIDGFNTFCVSRHAHDHGAKVVLSGLGGDELFGGYPSFQRVPRLVAASRWLGLAGPFKRVTARAFEATLRAPQYRRLASYLAGWPSSAGAYWCIRGIFTPREAEELTRKYCGTAPPAGAGIHFGVPAQRTPGDEVGYLEMTRYMRNQLLRDSDVMSMAQGLELRVPFVDARLVETVSRIPSELRLLPGKRLLTAAIPELPEWVINQPKRGFSFPFERWMGDDWRAEFERIDVESPVRLGTWYRRWSLFTLENFLSKLGSL